MNHKLYLISFLLVTSLLKAGTERGGGTPEVLLAQCTGSVSIFAPIGQETTNIRAVVEDKSLTHEALYFSDLGFSFSANQVHFVVTKPGTPKDAFYLQIDTEQTNGAFLGTLSINKKSQNISCSRLNDRFRPMAERNVNVEFLHGARKCLDNNQCVGFIGGILPEKQAVRMRFNMKTGQIEGKWQIEKTVFESTAVFELSLTQRRGGPLISQFALSLKEESNPTVFISEGPVQKVQLQTPALRLGNHTLSLWQKVKLSQE